MESQVPQLVEEAVQKSHEQLMARLDNWLLMLEHKLCLDEYETLPSHKLLGSGHASHASHASHHGSHAEGSGDPDEDARSEASGSQTSNPSPAAEVKPRKLSERSQSSYDLAKKEGSRLEVYKKLHTQSMSPTANSAFVKRYCPGLERYQQGAARIVKSPRFEMFFAVVLVSNALYIGAQIQWMSANPVEILDPGFTVVHAIYAAIFTIEVALNLLGFGCKKFLCSSGWAWGWLDILVVVSAWIELSLDLEQMSNSHGSNTSVRIVRVFKFTRILQGLRSLRIVRYVSGLRILVYSMFDASKSLLWAIILLGLIMYVFGLLFSSAALDYVVATNTVDPKLDQYFGSVDAAVTTLYRSILGGLDWGEAAGPLGNAGPVWVQVFHFYIGFVIFGILNVMTGVFCNSAIRAAEHDHTIMMQNRTQFRDMAADLFKKMDATGFGQITINEFEHLYDDEDMKAFLDSIEISASDAWTLFASLDQDGNGLIGINEFTEGCLKLHGPARSVDLYALRQQHLKFRDNLAAIVSNQNRIMEKLQERTHWPRRPPLPPPADDRPSFEV